MFWLFAIVSYLFSALNALADKFILVKIVPSAARYAFFVGLLSGTVFVFVPLLGFPVPAFYALLVALIAGALFIAALIVYYRGIILYDVSRIAPAVGGLSPAFVLLGSFLFFAEKEFVWLNIAALVLFVAGSVVITMERGKVLATKSFLIALAASFLFAVYFILMKYVYLQISLWPGFFWTRAGSFLAALLLLAFAPHLRSGLFSYQSSERAGERAARKRPIKPIIFFLGSKSLAGIAAIFQNIAIYLAPPLSVALINSLQGTQYLFLIFIAAYLSMRYPDILKESFLKRSAFQIASAALLFIAGIIFLIIAK